MTADDRSSHPTRSVPALSPRLAAIVDALPLAPGMRVLEIGCGPGAAAREVARRVAPGHVMAIDRSAAAVSRVERTAAAEISAGRLSVRCVAVEDFELDVGEPPFDLVFAVRVGALDGRHPAVGEIALQRLSVVMAPGADLFVDGGDPLRRIDVPRP